MMRQMPDGAAIVSRYQRHWHPDASSPRLRPFIDQILASRSIREVDIEELSAEIAQTVVSERADDGRRGARLLLAVALEAGEHLDSDGDADTAAQVRRAGLDYCERRLAMPPWPPDVPPEFRESQIEPVADALSVHFYLARFIEFATRGAASHRSHLQPIVSEVITYALDGFAVTRHSALRAAVALWLLIDVVPASLRESPPEMRFRTLLDLQAA